MSNSGIVLIGFAGTLIPYFVGWFVFRFITKQNNPFKKPKEVEKRPRWFLALWTGLGIGAVFSMPLVGMDGDILGETVVRIAFFIIFFIPGLIGYWLYRRKVK